MNEENIDKKSMRMAESYVSRALNKLFEAKEHLKKGHYSESISSSQECIELSIKAIFLLLNKNYPRKHEFTEKEFEEILRKTPPELGDSELPKLYLYSKFWSHFYTVAKYGLEEIGMGADKLFEKEEAELALKHAERCNNSARSIFTTTLSRLKLAGEENGEKLEIQ